MQIPDNLIHFFTLFPDDLSCRKYLEQRLWKNGVPICPHCGHSEKIYRYKNGKLFKCACCKKQFKVTTGTIYENSNIPLRKWFLAFYLLAVSKKGISSIELSKTLGVTQKSAWYLLHKIRYMLKNKESHRMVSGTVELDETYIGPRKPRIRGSKRGRGTDKQPVFGALQRKGNLYITPVPDTKRKTLEPIIREKVQAGTTIYSDEWWAYKQLYRHYTHRTVNQGTKEYARGDVHVNSLEGAWAHLKRSLMGTYHRPSKKHLDKYCAEFQFNYNTRNQSPGNKFRQTISKNNLRVKYKDITT